MTQASNPNPKRVITGIAVLAVGSVGFFTYGIIRERNVAETRVSITTNGKTIIAQNRSGSLEFVELITTTPSPMPKRDAVDTTPRTHMISIPAEKAAELLGNDYQLLVDKARKENQANPKIVSPEMIEQGLRPFIKKVSVLNPAQYPGIAYFRQRGDRS